MSVNDCARNLNIKIIIYNNDYFSAHKSDTKLFYFFFRYVKKVLKKNTKKNEGKT